MHEEAGHEVHVPQRSFAPIVLAAGIFCFNLGIAFGVHFIVLGLLIFAYGVLRWVREDVEYFRKGDGEPHG